GTGGIYASAEDLASFGNMLIGNKPNVLTESSAEKMANEEYKRGVWLPEGMDNTVGYGLGWDSVDSFPFGQYGIKALVKGGDSLLSHASLVTLPEHDLVVAVVSSGGSSAINQIYATGILLQTLKEKSIIAEIKQDKTFITPAAVEMPKNMEKYSGLYGTKGVTTTIEVKDSQMKVSIDYMKDMPDQVFKY
ncbi:MAG: serine hydrolase domain-containing protein, partial [Anaerovorax sp.]